jgi:hypothetical protein
VVVSSALADVAPEPLAGRLVRGVIGGVVSGAVFIVATMWFVASTGGPAVMPLRMISTIVLGDAAMGKGTTSPGLGLLVHLVLSAGFGVAFGLVVPWLRTNGTVAVAGVGYGVLLYLVDFQVLARLFFTTFKMANQPFEVVVHVVFGVLLAFAFFGSGVRRGEPAVAVAHRAAGGHGSGTRRHAG